MVEPDEHLVRRARVGDRRAFSLLVDRYERPARAMAMSVLRCPHDAGDAVQDAFVAAYERLNTLWSPRKFGAWFLRIVRRQALWHLRRRKTRARQLASIRPGSPPESGGTRSPSEDMITLIGRLPAQEAVVVTLRHLDDRCMSEIAEMTGRPVGTVTKQLSRAYARMRYWLGEREET